MDGHGNPELRIEGYAGTKLLLVRRFCSDRSRDRLWLELDEARLRADGTDSTRLAFGVVDRFGGPRPFVQGDVTLEVDGPANLVGDNPFSLKESGGSGAVWVKSIAGRSGVVEIRASHDLFKPQSAVLHVF